MARNGFSPLAGNRRLTLGFYHQGNRKLRRWMARQSPRVVGMIFHHIVGDIDALQGALMNPTRTLSVNYGIGHGKVWGCVAEQFKANTSSHQADHSHITVETANVTLAPTYKIGDADFDVAARLAADCGHAHGFVPSRETIRWHREFYPTECPGPDFWGRRDEFIALARRYYYERLNPTPAPKPDTPKEERMSAAEVKEIKDYMDRLHEQTREIIRRESRLRAYQHEDTGEVMLARLEWGVRVGPFSSEEELRAALPKDGDHQINWQEWERRLHVPDSDWKRLLEATTER